LNIGGKLLTKGLGVAALVATIGATGADAIAYLECYDVENNPKIENVCNDD
jgi:hypothetical protein